MHLRGPLKYLIGLIIDLNFLQEKVKKHPVTENGSSLLLFEQIDLVISKVLQILGLEPRTSKVSKQF